MPSTRPYHVCRGGVRGALAEFAVAQMQRFFCGTHHDAHAYNTPLSGPQICLIAVLPPSITLALATQPIYPALPGVRQL